MIHSKLLLLYIKKHKFISHLLDAMKKDKLFEVSFSLFSSNIKNNILTEISDIIICLSIYLFRWRFIGGDQLIIGRL